MLLWVGVTCCEWEWNELEEDKTNKIIYVSSEDSDQPAHQLSLLGALWEAKDPKLLHAYYEDAN